jgi:DNA-binding FadR family transcriptional regulator
MFEKIHRQPLSEVIAGTIEESILSGTFAIGTQMPSEPAMSKQFGVSRNVVREAYKILQERGLLDIRDGNGAFVAQPDTTLTKNALGRYIRLIGADSALDSIFESRIILEGSNARLAATRATPEEIEELATHLARMHENLEFSNRWTESDLDFHIAVAKATHNPFQLLLLEPLVDQLREIIWEGFMTPGAKLHGLEEHDKMFDCIKKCDPEGAYNAMIEHLRFSQEISKQHWIDKTKTSENR